MDKFLDKFPKIPWYIKVRFWFTRWLPQCPATSTCAHCGKFRCHKSIFHSGYHEHGQHYWRANRRLGRMCFLDAVPLEFWTDWRGNPNGETERVAFEEATMLIKRLFSWRGWNVDLHCFVGQDAPECFHTHQAWSFRFVLWGGYIEELETGQRRLWFPFRFGFVSPRLSHRVVTPIYDLSWSLWIRSPKKYKVELRGNGWNRNGETAS